METNATTFEHASAMPAPTWHFLDMNDTTIQIPDGLSVSPCVKVDGDWGTCSRVDGLLGERGIEHGTGAQASAFLRSVAGTGLVVEAAEGQEVDARIAVEAVPGAVSVAAVDVVASAGSNVRLSIAVDGPSADQGAQGAEIAGVVGTTVRVFAEAGSRVDITRMQTLGEGFSDIDDMGMQTMEGARVDVHQVVLGGARSYAGLAGELVGESSQVNVDTRYLGYDDHELDFNYILRHRGRDTKCNLQADGVLAGSSSKTLRGTIDLVKGCKGAEGVENESVLLVDERVRCKTIPVILCGEDDVAGNHGATIGHIRDEQLFYLASRGLSQEAAERMFVDAALEQAVLDAPDEACRAGALRLGERLSPGFSALIEGEV